jgi:hypothetical protein
MSEHTDRFTPPELYGFEGEEPEPDGDPKNGPVQRLDGRWLAYRRGLPLMTQDFSNRVFATHEAAQHALEEARA